MSPFAIASRDHARAHGTEGPPGRPAAGARFPSPLRYPGGKSRLLPFARAWIDAYAPGGLLVEPFAGGASIGVMAAVEGRSARVLLGDADPELAAFWSTVVDPVAGERFADWIERVEPLAWLDAHPRPGPGVREPRERTAGRLLLENRIAYGGIRHRAGRVGNRLARWYPGTLAGRVRTICRSGRASAHESDGLRLLAAFPCSPAYVDPPYTASAGSAGHRLYGVRDVDHVRLAGVLAGREAPLLVSYDDTPETVGLLARAGLETVRIRLQGNRGTGTELLASNRPIRGLAEAAGVLA